MSSTKRVSVSVMKAATSEADGVWAISSDSTDRVGDVISLPALKSQVGRQPLICLWQHDPSQPVGKWYNFRMKGTQLVADLQLANTNLAAMIKELLAIGTPLGASVGFRGSGEPKEKGYLFKTIELLETSIVSVPCNPDAMQIAKSFGLSSVISGEPEVSAVSGASSPDHLIRAKAAILAANRTLRI